MLPLMTDRELTQAMIDEAMTRAERAACAPRDERCFPLRWTPKDARETCTSTGRCQIGTLAAESGRKSWDVWLDVHTGGGRLRRRNQ